MRIQPVRNLKLLHPPAQNPLETAGKPVRFPKTVRHRKCEAVIYGKSKAYPFYRAASDA